MRASMKKKTFAISYKLRYAETEDESIDYLEAIDKEHALIDFAKLKNIEKKDFRSFKEWIWEEGVWWAKFKNIKQVKEIPCPHCSGKGTIYL